MSSSSSSSYTSSSSPSPSHPPFPPNDRWLKELPHRLTIGPGTILPPSDISSSAFSSSSSMPTSSSISSSSSSSSTSSSSSSSSPSIVPLLFTPLKFKSGLVLKNRIGVSPMCQYSSDDGYMSDWHLVHLGNYAKGGAGLIIFEASAVCPEGRITAWDAGIYKDEHVEMMKRIVSFIKIYNAAAGIQIAHAGRKASTNPPFFKSRGAIPEDDLYGWKPQGPSSIPWDEKTYLVPAEMTLDDIRLVVRQFGQAAARAKAAGFDFVEVHGAHGYLIHSFLSPLSNKRQDDYGGSYENRVKLLKDIVREVRVHFPPPGALSVRLSCVEWAEGGWSLQDTVRLSRELSDYGVDLIDCSSGGNVSTQQITNLGPGYQVEFSHEVKKHIGGDDVGMHTAAVGLITQTKHAEEILQNKHADIILLAREFIREPYWPLKAAAELGVEVGQVPQYDRAPYTRQK
eukprot:TRINITY_DN10644_c0_g3_i2.p1 TRINITY_DN10644_c0_g3~~TRINITY_DN10644_c0_g3_i2.p1  ORF type:complete len:504 (+),score=107.21 TRINITY_DN10644_c0_g3_i2:150-1514(+)